MEDLFETYCSNNKELLYKTLYELTCIPAPCGMEQQRATYCINWLESQGIKESIIDKCGNVIAFFKADQSGKNSLLMAHLDTVFPMETDLKITECEGVLCCPGIGDDTANAVILLMLAKFLWKHKKEYGKGLILAWNVGEEGLGNLRGCRQLMGDYKNIISEVISFDLYWNTIYTTCIGSIRYDIEIQTSGGHSYLDFGKSNAIERMADLIEKIYHEFDNDSLSDKVTYNVGAIQGGISVNTIAQHCNILFEFRASNNTDLEKADNYLIKLISNLGEEEVKYIVKTLGQRPCAEKTNEKKMNRLTEICIDAVKQITGEEPKRGAASTDCNIPLSMGVPAVCIGLITGGGAHSEREWISGESVETGLRIGLQLINNLLEKRYIIREQLIEEKEKKAIANILSECDSNFYPPLSKRKSTVQKKFEYNPKISNGIEFYYEDVLKQSTLLWKEKEQIVAFLSFRPYFTCDELKNYKQICYLTTLCIKKEFRGLGIAPKIYAAVEEYIRCNFPESVIALRTWSTNSAQLHIMDKLQFKCVACLKNDRGEGIDTVYFVKE